MEKYKLVSEENSIIRNHNENYSIRNYLTKDFNDNFSIAVSELDGKHELTKSIASDRIYYFIEGNAIFNIEGSELNVSSNDVLFIEKNTEYCFEGKFKAILINIPAFGIEFDRNK